VTRRSSGEEGFTIVEVVVAVFVLAMGALATFGVLSAATKNTERAKATQVALDLAQQEMERLRSLPNEELAMEKLPPHSNDPLDPNYRVNASLGTFAVSREPLGSPQKMVRNGGEVEGEPERVIEHGVIRPSERFENGDVKGTIHRYVVWRNDDSCGTACPTRQDFKQIVVAVKLDTPGSQTGERGYVEVQSDFVDPTHSPASDPAPGPERKVVTAQQLYLSDTPCSATGTTVREEATEDHDLHNTLGTCASGLSEGSTPGAPDALLLGAPPSSPDGTDPPLYDYSSNLEFMPETGRGVQLLRDEKTNGCPFYNEWPAGTTNLESKVHLWVTDPMASSFTITGRVTIEFYTRTIDNAEKTKGTLCVYLFRRSKEEGSPPKATDFRLTNTNGTTPYWKYTPEKNGLWPARAWTKTRMTMNFNGAPYTINTGERLGVALSVEPQNTQTVAIPIMYDHPNYPTRIEVDTTTPIEGG
jgi:Tfp pilus assembly protein PilE